MVEQFLTKTARFIEQHGWIGLLVIGGSISRAFLDATPVTLLRIARLVIVGAFAGALAALFLEGTDYSASTKGAMIGVTSLLAEDILISTLAIAAKLRADPVSAINWLLRRK